MISSTFRHLREHLSQSAINGGRNPPPVRATAYASLTDGLPPT